MKESGAGIGFEFRWRNIRGAEDAEERDAEGVEGVGSVERCPPPQLGWSLGRGCAPPKENLVKFPLNRLILQHFMRITKVRE